VSQASLLTLELRSAHWTKKFIEEEVIRLLNTKAKTNIMHSQLLIACGSGREQLWKYGFGFCAVLAALDRDACGLLFEMVLGKVALR